MAGRLRRVRARLRVLASAGRLGRFVSVGLIGAAFDNAVSITLNELGVLPELAALAGIETAIVVMFLLNDNWTFDGAGEAGAGPLFRRFLRSHLVRAGGVAVQLVVFTSIYRLPGVIWTLDGFDAWFVVARLAGISVAMVVNYAAESTFTWQVHDDE